MQYIIPSEISLLAPEVASNTLLADDSSKRAFIIKASAIADGACNRARFGLEIRDVRRAQIRLSPTLSGVLPHDPFIEWLGTDADVFYFGNQQSNGTVTLSDFSVLESGVIRNLSTRFTAGFSFDKGFSGGGYNSQFGQAGAPYHSSSYGLIEENSSPYLMVVDFRAGKFTEREVEVTGSAGDNFTYVKVTTLGLNTGDEFYFSTDPEQEPDITHRFITAVDTTLRRIEFEPAVQHALTVGEKVRRVDLSVRSACADIIADLITYPPNTKQFDKNLGSGNIQKSWTRMNDIDVPVTAASKLAPYVRL